MYRIIRILVFLGCVFVPFTELRFGFIGPGEVFLLAAFIIYLHATHGEIRFDVYAKPVIQFWILYLVVITIGFGFNFFFLGQASGTIEGALFDLSSYIFILITVFLFSDNRIIHLKDDKLIFTHIYYAWSFIFIFLYALSLRQSSFFGFRLRNEGGHFIPLVENVHQASMITCALPFLGYYLFLRSDHLLKRIFLAVSIPMFVVMALESHSTKAMMALFFSPFIFLFFAIFYRTHGRNRQLFNIFSFLIAGVIGIVIFAFYFEEISRLAIEFFKEEDPKQAREILYGKAITHGLDSIVVGYGPGPHIIYSGNTYSDTHNTLLTIFVQGGVIGLLLFILLWTKLIRLISISESLIAVIGAIGIYTLGGDILRRIPIWIIIMSLVSYAKTDQAKCHSPVARLGGSAAGRNPLAAGRLFSP